VLIVALDPPTGLDAFKWISTRLRLLEGIVSGFKIGLPALLRLGIDRVREIVKTYSSKDLLLIADLKLADVGFVMKLSAEVISYAGFNAIIAHSFIGVEGALEVLAQRCRELGLRLITVVSMTHPAASKMFDPILEQLINIAKEVGSWGIVVPATRPNVIRRARQLVGSEIKILAPGVGAQGATPGEAICSGADYEIVGRSITYSEDPYRAALQILSEQRERVARCRG